MNSLILFCGFLAVISSEMRPVEMASKFSAYEIEEWKDYWELFDQHKKEASIIWNQVGSAIRSFGWAPTVAKLQKVLQKDLEEEGGFEDKLELFSELGLDDDVKSTDWMENSELDLILDTAGEPMENSEFEGFLDTAVEPMENSEFDSIFTSYEE